MIHTVKGFSIVNEKEVDVFLEFSCFFYDPMDVGNLISGSSAFSKSNLNIWKFLVHMLLNPSLEVLEYLTDLGEFVLPSKKGNAKESSDYLTTALISHARKAVLKILQARLQH